MVTWAFSVMVEYQCFLYLLINQCIICRVKFVFKIPNGEMIVGKRSLGVCVCVCVCVSETDD